MRLDVEVGDVVRRIGVFVLIGRAADGIAGGLDYEQAGGGR